VRRVGPGQPIGTDAVVQTQSIQTQLEGAHVESTMRSMVILAGARLSEQGCGTIAAGLRQHIFGQLEHEVGTGLRWLVGYRRVCPLSFVAAFLAPAAAGASTTTTASSTVATTTATVSSSTTTTGISVGILTPTGRSAARTRCPRGSCGIRCGNYTLSSSRLAATAGHA